MSYKKTLPDPLKANPTTDEDRRAAEKYKDEATASEFEALYETLNSCIKLDNPIAPAEGYYLLYSTGTGVTQTIRWHPYPIPAPHEEVGEYTLRLIVSEEGASYEWIASESASASLSE